MMRYNAVTKYNEILWQVGGIYPSAIFYWKGASRWIKTWRKQLKTLE